MGNTESGRLSPCYSAPRIARRVRELADAIQRDYQGQELVVVGVLKGSFVFVADLVRLLDLPLELDFLGLSSYGSTRRSSGRVAITVEPSIPLQGRNVLLVEDILESGLTTAFAVDYLRQRGAGTLKVCVLIEKTARRSIEVPVDYRGFRLKSGFVVGYGTDHGERFRNLPDIRLLQDS